MTGETVSTTNAPMVEEYITFGQRYRHEVHPTYPKAHPDGYVRLVAPDPKGLEELESRYFLDPETGILAFAFRYRSIDALSPEHYPLGLIETLTL